MVEVGKAGMKTGGGERRAISSYTVPWGLAEDGPQNGTGSAE